MCLQEAKSRRVWKKSCFQEAGMIIIPPSSVLAGFSLVLRPLFLPAASSNQPSPPPPSFPPSLSRTSDAAMISPCSLWVAASIHYSTRWGSCLGAVLQCSVLQGFAWSEHAETNTPVIWIKMLLCVCLSIKIITSITTLVLSCCCCENVREVSCSVMWEDLVAEGHMTFLFFKKTAMNWN